MRPFCSATLAFGALLLAAARLAGADAIEFQSGQARTALLELYTSEGCSSCPPAEEWLARLKESPKLWKDFVPVAFHVDYWDYLGWKDPFAARAYTRRQHDYADTWRSRSVYTPGFVLDGKEWRGWSAEPPRPSSRSAGVLTARSEDGRRWTLRFRPAEGGGPSAYDCHAALLGSDLISDVKAGENRGRKLRHDFVVLALADTPATRKEDYFQGEVTLSATLATAPARRAFAVWITPVRSLQPAQAAGGWLSATNR